MAGRSRHRRTSRPPTSSPRGSAAGFSSTPPRASISQMEGQYVAYSFFRVDPDWRRLAIDERAAGKDAFDKVIEDGAGRMDSLRAYTVTGLRADSDFVLWRTDQRYVDLG